MAGNYFKFAWRRIAKQKVYAIINILGLSLGLCACMVIYLVTRNEFSYDAFHPDKERIYRIVGDMQMKKKFRGKIPMNSIPAPAPAAIRREFTGIDAVAGFRFYDHPVTIKNAENQTRKFESDEQVIITEPSYFDIFHYKWLAGNAASALNEPFKVVISESKARKYFGLVPIEKMIGRTVVYNDSLSVSVSGIVKDWGKNTDFPFTDFISSKTLGKRPLKNEIRPYEWGQNGSLSFCLVKLSRDISASHINAQLAALIDRNMGTDSFYRINLHLQPLSDIHFNEAYIHRDYESRKAHLPSLYALMGIAFFILAIAVLNFINLSTAQSIGRTKEICVRKILGSGRTALIVGSLMETGILTFLAVCISSCLVKPVLSLFHSYLPPGITSGFFDPSFLFFALSLLAATWLLAGIYPARSGSSHPPTLNLKAPGKDLLTLRKGLIVFQFSISLVFIMGALVINKQIKFMRHTDMGFNPDGIVTIRPSPGDSSGELKPLAERIRQLPGVGRTSLQSFPPLEEFSGYLLHVEYKGEKKLELPVEMRQGPEDYIPLYQVRLLAGRNLAHSDSLNELVINETLSGILGFTEPREAVGQLLYAGGKALRIVGVMADFHSSSFYKPIGPQCIGHIPEEEKSIAIKFSIPGTQTGNRAQDIKAIGMNKLLLQINQLEKEIAPGETFECHFFEDTLAHLYDKEDKTAWLINIATGIVLFISCIGLLGVIMFTTVRRAREISIRKVLGAGVADIASLLAGDFGILVALALLIASPIAWYFMTRWLQGFSYRITIDGWVFLPAGALALSMALLTIGIHILKAAIVNPAQNLRAE